MDFRDDDGNTSMHLAVSHDYPSMIKILYAAGANVNVTNRCRETPLHIAASQGAAVASRALLECGAKVDIEDDEGARAHYRAAFHCRVDIVKQLLTGIKKTDLNAPLQDGRTALHAAVDNVELTGLLVDAGADVRVRDKVGDTPFHLAAYCSDLEVSRLLLKLGADLKAANNEGLTAFHLAAQEGYLSIVKFLREEGTDYEIKTKNGSTALHLAAYEGHEDVMAYLLENGMNEETQSEEYGSLLTASALSGNPDLVKFLIAKGIKVNAVEEMKLDCVRILLEHHADPNITIHDHEPPLQIAAKKGSFSILKILISHGADAMVKDRNGRSILFSAISWNSIEVANFLLHEHNLDINEKNLAGRSILIAAVTEYHYYFVDTLFDNGADPNMIDSEMMTPLIRAVVADNVGIVKTLLEHCANPRIKDARGRDALYWACRGWSNECFDTILEALCQHQNFDGDYSIDIESAIHAAVTSNKSNLLAKLLKVEPINLSNNDMNGWTPLYTAKKYGFEVIESMLVAAGAVEQEISLQRPSKWDEWDKAASLRLSLDAQEITISGEWQKNALFRPRTGKD